MTKAIIQSTTQGTLPYNRRVETFAKGYKLHNKLYKRDKWGAMHTRVEQKKAIGSVRYAMFCGRNAVYLEEANERISP